MQSFSRRVVMFGLVVGRLLSVGSASAQVLSPLYTFQNTNDLNPKAAELLLVNNSLYGTMLAGPSADKGTFPTSVIFKLNTDGSGFTNLHIFSPLGRSAETNTDGATTSARLVPSGDQLFGTTQAGGLYGNGIIFAINTDGSGFTNLHNFSAYGASSTGFQTNSDGAAPTSGLILSGNKLYGTTSAGGAFGGGTVFAINTDGTGLTTIYNFTAFLNPNDTNADGFGPKSALVLSGSTLYGTARRGGTGGAGTVYRVDLDGSGFTNLHSFSPLVRMTTPPYIYTNSSGTTPYGALVLQGGRLYGTTLAGGTNTASAGTTANGTLFAVNTDGTDFTVLRHLGKDAGTMESGLTLSGSVLYGSAAGGILGEGTVFSIITNGTGFALLNSFTLPTYNSASNSYTNIAGVYPEGAPALSGNFLYGVTRDGGANPAGTVFALNLSAMPPSVAFTANPTNGFARLTVQFNAPAVDVDGNAIVAWNWTFGDGSTNISTVPSPSYTYTNAATYLPTLGCINSYGNTVVGSGSVITVAPPPPIEFTASPTQGFPPPLAVNFTSPAKDAGNNAFISWNWQFGDGSSSTAQNPSHVYTNAGTFSPSLTCKNIHGDAVAGAGPEIVVLNSLLLNGGFETGTFTNWTQSGATNGNGGRVPTTRVTTGSAFAHSGRYGADLAAPGADGALGFLSQTFSTDVGRRYLISFWLDSPFSFDTMPTEFQVSWDGNVIFDETKLAMGWTNIQLTVTATSTNSTLQFGYLTGSFYFGLDEIGVASIESSGSTQPDLSSVTLSGTDLVLNSGNGVANQTYRVLMSTDLSVPLSQWTPVATNSPASTGNFSITLANAVSSNAGHQFYVLQAP